MQIRLNVVGGVFKPLDVPEGSTVGDVISNEGLSVKEARVNMRTVKLDEVLNENDSVYVVPKIKGNR